MLYLAVNSYNMKALIYGLFYRKYSWILLPGTWFLGLTSHLATVNVDSDTVTSDPDSVGLPIIKPWHVVSGQQTPTWSSGNSTDFMRWPLKSIQESLFAYGVYSNKHSQRCITAQSTPIYFIHVCLKSVSETFGSLSRYMKPSPVDIRIRDLH